MFSKSLKEQIKVRWREFRREPSAFFWVMFMPAVWMVALGFAFSKPHPETYGVGWLPPASGTEWTELLNATLKQDQQLHVVASDQQSLETKMLRGEISLIVRPGENKSLVYKFDQANPEAVRAKKHVDDLLQRASGRQDIITSSTESMSAEGGRYVDFLIPGILGLTIMTTSLHGIGMTIVSNRKENLLKRYLVTPLRAYEYIISHLIGRMVILAIEFAVVMLTGALIFRFKVYGSYFDFAIFTILGAAAFTSIALLCAARTKSTPMISGLTDLISLPMMMLSGVFFSKNNFPDWLKEVTTFLPLTAVNDGLRKIALEGLPLSHLGFELGVLLVFILVPGILSTRLFKWY